MSILIDILKELPLSSILREKLLLQASQSEAKIIALEAENKALKVENTILKAENAQLKTKVQHLEDKIKHIEKDNEPPEDWGDIEPV